MSRQTTIHDVARLARVSPSTVSNLLNGRHDRMRPATRQRIQQAIDRLGYTPSRLARQLKNGYAYPDPGNQAVQDGRADWRLTFDVLQPWLCCVGVKNGGWFPAEIAPSGQRRWRSDWLGLADGMVPWDAIIAYLRASGYNGFLSFHSHYEVPLAQVLDQTCTDLRFIRRQIEAHQPATLVTA